MKRILRSPFSAKREMGTAVLTYPGMAGRFSGWFVPVGIHPLVFGVGSIVKKPGVVGDSIQVRDILHLTISFDHDVVDGAPAARAFVRLAEKIERGYGL